MLEDGIISICLLTKIFKVLIAEGVTSALDAGAQASVVRLLRTLQENRGWRSSFSSYPE